VIAPVRPIRCLGSSGPGVAPMGNAMRRTAIAVLLLVLAALLFAPFVVGVAFIAVLAALVAGVFLLVGRRLRRKGDSLVPWLVSLGISAVITTPQIALEGHYKHIGGRVFAGVLWWLVLAALLRLAIFVADYFRKRFSEHEPHMLPSDDET
jgi:O-antigen/teichoic acid export membrane protein